MCGRFTLSCDADEIGAAFEADTGPLRPFHGPRYNVAPTDTVPVVIAAGEGRRAGPMRWGMASARRRAPRLLINARSETVAGLPTFRDSFRARRCLAPADGYYEWEARPSGKQPYWIHREGAAAFAMAGIWRYESAAVAGDARSGSGESGPPRREAAFAILTRTAPPSLEWLHPRVPLVLPESAWDAWLARGTDLRTLVAIIAAADPPPMRFHPVSRAVNRVGHDEPDCIEAVELD